MENNKPTTFEELTVNTITTKVAMELINLETIKAKLTDYITSPFRVNTPPEKVKRRPDGFDYIESSWMDKQFKESTPLYTHDLVHFSESLGWVTAIVKVTDRITGNSELGAASVRIQVRKEVSEPTFRDIIDKGNNVAAVVTKAIKNAQSRFGHGADVYGKRESIKSEEERLRFDQMVKELRALNPQKAAIFESQWKELGTDYSDYLDNWEGYLNKIRNAKKDGIPSKKIL
jgi:hypothetical protein